MANDGSLACQTNCDTAYPVLWSFSKNVTICFKDLDLTLIGYRDLNLRPSAFETNALTECAIVKKIEKNIED